MKRITSICSAITLLAAFFVTAGVSAQIEFEADENGLRVNGKTIDPSNLPEGLADILADKEFFLRWIGPSPMLVSVNGVQYEVSEDRIVESDKTDVLSFEIVADPSGTISIGSNRLDRPKGRNMGRMFIQIGDYTDKISRTDSLLNERYPIFNLVTNRNMDEISKKDSLLQVIRVASSLLEERAELNRTQAEAIANRVVSVAEPEMISPFEIIQLYVVHTRLPVMSCLSYYNMNGGKSLKLGKWPLR